MRVQDRYLLSSLLFSIVLEIVVSAKAIKRGWGKAYGLEVKK